jgi:hypothetical protein
MQFIYSQQNVLTPKECSKFIEAFEKSSLKKPGKVISQSSGMSVRNKIEAKKSTDIGFDVEFFDEWNVKEKKLWMPLMEILFPAMQKSLNNYITKFPEIDNLPPFSLLRFNLQKYEPGEGFYQWHCERSHGPTSTRMLVWMIYLNDVDDGGTEFLYQEYTEKAEAGKLLIWPPDWTHTHRGQISYTKTKYILTGWFHFI